LKFRPTLTEIKEKEFDKMEYQGISGVEFYLGDRERQIEKAKKIWEALGKTKGLIRLARRR
jgi:hypothetical protein